MHRNDVIIHPSDKIKHFLRKSVAAQAYGDMFANGEYFKMLGLHIPSSPVYSFSALEHLRKLSHVNFKRIREKIGTLDDAEYNLLRKISIADIFFQHRTEAELINCDDDDSSDDEGYEDYSSYDHHPQTLSLYSYKQLLRRNMLQVSHTEKEDIQTLNNHDFVFFNCEFDCTSSPRNRYHNGMYYGDFSYVIGEEHPMVKYGYMTLSDHMKNTIFPTNEKFSRRLFLTFPELKQEVTGNIIYQNDNHDDTPIFDFTLMKPGLALYLIDFLRRTASDNFRKFVYDENFTFESLHDVLNTVFSPELHIPRGVFTRTYRYECDA